MADTQWLEVILPLYTCLLKRHPEWTINRHYYFRSTSPQLQFAQTFLILCNTFYCTETDLCTAIIFMSWVHVARPRSPVHNIQYSCNGHFREHVLSLKRVDMYILVFLFPITTFCRRRPPPFSSSFTLT